MLPKITHLLNEFPSVFSPAMLSLRPGTPPFNWSASWPLPSTSSFSSRTKPRCSLEGYKVVKPLSAGQEGQAECLSAEVCLCVTDLIDWCQLEEIRWVNETAFQLGGGVFGFFFLLECMRPNLLCCSDFEPHRKINWQTAGVGFRTAAQVADGIARSQVSD